MHAAPASNGVRFFHRLNPIRNKPVTRAAAGGVRWDYRSDGRPPLSTSASRLLRNSLSTNWRTLASGHPQFVSREARGVPLPHREPDQIATYTGRPPGTA